MLPRAGMLPADQVRSAFRAVSVLSIAILLIANGVAADFRDLMPRTRQLQGQRRSLRTEITDTCYTADTAAASVNTTLQLQAEQQLQNQQTQQNVLSALSQYLRAPDCDITLAYNQSTVCPAVSAVNSTGTCSDGQYICRGVTQIAQDVYTAVQNDQCSPDVSSSTADCQGTEVDLTTYLSIQQGQCCLQCPGQPDCNTQASEASQNATKNTVAAYECGNYTLNVVVGSSLEGSSLQDLLNTAVSSGLLDLYLQTSGLPDATVLSLAATSKWAWASKLLPLGPMSAPTQSHITCI